MGDDGVRGDVFLPKFGGGKHEWLFVQFLVVFVCLGLCFLPLFWTIMRAAIQCGFAPQFFFPFPIILLPSYLLWFLFKWSLYLHSIFF